MPHVDDTEGGADDVVTDPSKIDISDPSEKDDRKRGKRGMGGGMSDPGGVPGGGTAGSGPAESPARSDSGGAGGGSGGRGGGRDRSGGGGGSGGSSGGGGAGSGASTGRGGTKDGSSGGSSGKKTPQDTITDAERQEAASRLEQRKTELSVVERGVLSERDITVRPEDVMRAEGGSFSATFSLTDSGRAALAERAVRRDPDIAALDPSDIRVEGQEVIVPAELDTGATGQFEFDLESGEVQTIGFGPGRQPGPTADAEVGGIVRPTESAGRQPGPTADAEVGGIVRPTESPFADAGPDIDAERDTISRIEAESLAPLAFAKQQETAAAGSRQDFGFDAPVEFDKQVRNDSGRPTLSDLTTETELERDIRSFTKFQREGLDEFLASPEGKPTPTDRFFQTITFGVGRNPNARGTADDVAKQFLRGTAGDVNPTIGGFEGLNFAIDVAQANERLLDINFDALVSGDPKRIRAAAELDREVFEVASRAGPAAAAGILDKASTPEGAARLAGGVAGGVGSGLLAGRTIERGSTLARNVRIRRQADEVIDIEDLTTERGLQGDLPKFETSTREPTDVAVQEVRRRAADQPEGLVELADDESLLLRSESEALPSDFTAGRGQFELPGLFTSPDLSPLRLLDDAERSLDLNVRLPQLRSPGDQVTSFPGSRIEGMPASAQGARRIVDPDTSGLQPDPSTAGARFLETQAEPGTAFVRPTGSRTSELEAIFPPGSEFAETGQFAVRSQSGRLIEGRAFSRVESEDILRADLDFSIETERLGISDLPETRLSSRPGQPASPVPVGPGNMAVAETDFETRRREVDASPDSLSSELDSLSEQIGLSLSSRDSDLDAVLSDVDGASRSASKESTREVTSGFSGTGQTATGQPSTPRGLSETFDRPVTSRPPNIGSGSGTNQPSQTPTSSSSQPPTGTTGEPPTTTTTQSPPSQPPFEPPSQPPTGPPSRPPEVPPGQPPPGRPPVGGDFIEEEFRFAEPFGTFGRRSEAVPANPDELLLRASKATSAEAELDALESPLTEPARKKNKDITGEAFSVEAPGVTVGGSDIETVDIVFPDELPEGL